LNLDTEVVFGLVELSFRPPLGLNLMLAILTGILKVVSPEQYGQLGLIATHQS